MTLYIGDVHGKYTQYKKIIKGATNTIQVGDMGVGFRKWPHGDAQPNPPHDKMLEGNHRFIRGNHDNPTVCKNHSQWIPDGHIENDTMFIGGAVSIDAQWRIEGYSWWGNEELSDEELEVLINKYIEAKPKIMVTHDCPEEISELILMKLPIIKGLNKSDFPSRSRKAFQRMWSAHSPDLWVFGHWHISVDQILRGTRFVCLAELEAKEL